MACDALSTFFKAYHERHGVVFEMGATAVAFEGRDGHVTGVVLDDGRTIACDAVVVGVGAHPNDEIAKDAGWRPPAGWWSTWRPAAPTGDLRHRRRGAPADADLRPHVPHGERAQRPGTGQAGRRRDHRAPGAGRPEVPWQWSDQYDLKLQIAGYAFDVDEILLRGDPASGKFAVFHLKGDLVQSVEAINSPPEFMMGKQLILGRKPIDKAKLADPSVSMKEVAA